MVEQEVDAFAGSHQASLFINLNAHTLIVLCLQ